MEKCPQAYEALIDVGGFWSESISRKRREQKQSEKRGTRSAAAWVHCSVAARGAEDQRFDLFAGQVHRAQRLGGCIEQLCRTLAPDDLKDGLG